MSLTEFAQPDLSLHMSNGGLLAVLVDKPLTDFRATFTQQQRDRGWQVAPATSLSGVLNRFSAWQVDSRRAARDMHSRIACVSIRVERLRAHLKANGKHATVVPVTRALNGDRSQLDSLQEWETDCFEYAEFLAILGELQKIQELQLELAYEIESSPQSYPVQGICTEPEFLKTPEQILCGAVSIKAPPAVPTDVIHSGYAVGCAA